MVSLKIKLKHWVWRDGSAVRSPCCFCRGPGLGPQHTCDGAQVSVTPVPGVSCPLLASRAPDIQVMQAKQACIKNLKTEMPILLQLAFIFLFGCCYLFWFGLVFWDGVSLCNPGCPRTLCRPGWSQTHRRSACLLRAGVIGVLHHCVVVFILLHGQFVKFRSGLWFEFFSFYAS